MKALIAMQFWEGDAKQAFEASKLIADMEENKRTDVDFMFFARWDTPLENMIDWQSTCSHVAKKFNTRWYRCKNKTYGQGWPDACNTMWSELAHEVTVKLRNQWETWEWCMSIESDCVPLQRDWINKLDREWRLKNVDFLGCMPERPPTHINGNMMFMTTPTAKYRCLNSTPIGNSWDCYHWEKVFKPNGAHTPLIVSRHNCKTIDEETLYAPLFPDESAPVFVHGVKDSSARDIVRKKFGL